MAGDGPPITVLVPLDGSVVTGPSPDTLAEPLIVRLVIATGEVIVPCGAAMSTSTVLPAGAVTLNAPASVSGMIPVRLQL